MSAQAAGVPSPIRISDKRRLVVVETLEYHTKTEEKKTWGEGPWLTEPDKMQFPDPCTGYPTLIVRQYEGTLCGYVGVSEGHPLFGVDWRDPKVKLRAHWGVNYSNHCQPGDEAKSICHIPGPGEPDHVWWFGFDCARAEDMMPELEARMAESYRLYREELPPERRDWFDNGGGEKLLRGEYRTVEYVKVQCGLLAAQLQYFAR